ncbi:bifunctional diguanylate cyclase/phosphodiesterase [[Phormidium] sp. ETS-05]|uniref:putative bifunctional diguanylate cyclase/phosphodiesterase n=1 Tax=[Phormidium] sp. ETS-05 TaxID=222819 RepID=UPI0018EF061C|nr:bifunctional diguanylate cyclase/phosphodiesterase [[Phormidium] sp. ETS-05]
MVNEGLGHEVGDRLLIAFADRLRAAVTLHCSSNTPIARVGADEFAILLENIKSASFATAIAEKLRHHLATPFHLQDLEIFTTVSIGIAVGEIGEQRDLLRDANTAMYRAKVSGKQTPELFETAMQARSIARFQTETDLRRALKSAPNVDSDFAGVVDSEFLVYYQPLVYLPTGRIAGFEALVRWGHPTKGLVFPGDFISIAEETGAIVPLGELVLYKACQQMQRWQQQFPQMQAPQMISVNLSGKQFTQPDLIDRIEYIIKTTQLPPHSLKLEITESVAMDNVETTIALLHRLKALHIKLGIDDFGTGYSSLSYLTQLPSDTLKVDRSFVSRMNEPDNKLIVKTIVALAHQLKMDIIAEGVETAEQLQQLRDLGCEYGQGYFFAKPLPQDKAEELLANDPRW